MYKMIGASLNFQCNFLTLSSQYYYYYYYLKNCKRRDESILIWLNRCDILFPNEESIDWKFSIFTYAQKESDRLTLMHII